MQDKATVYTIKKITENQIHNGELDMSDLITNKINGFVVADFLNNKELDEIINGYRNLNEKHLVHINSSFNSFPMSFAQYDQMLSKGILTDEQYFKISKSFINTFENKFGANIIDKLKKLFSSIINSPTIDLPYKHDMENRYVPFTFRELFAGEGCLKAHCENLFFQEFPSFFDKINSFSTLDNQLSFFILLQKPSKGGELTLFDILWNPEQRRLSDDEIKLQNGNQYFFDDTINIRRDSINLDTGSLIVFKGGEIWHRVEKVSSTPPRITLGGFLSFSHDGSKLYAWS